MPDKVNIGDLESTERGSGARKNVGKVDFSILPLHLLAGAARVQTAGSIKYNAYNWACGMRWSVCVGCIFRHLFKWWYLRKNIDKETGEHHLSLALLNILYLLHFTQAFPEGDDRPPKHAMFNTFEDEFNRPFDEAAYCERNGLAAPAEPSVWETNVIDVIA